MREEILRLREEMDKSNIDAYLVMTDDYHGSEYVGDYFKCRQYLSGFTGSAGRMVITKEEAVLWTDGRYFIQAEDELKGSGIELYKMGEPGVPDIFGYLESRLKEGESLGFDGRTVNAVTEQNLEKILFKKNVNVVYDCDLVSRIWENRPERNHSKAWFLDLCYAGMPPEEKIRMLRDVLMEKSCDAIIITALDEIAWLFNLRGNDVEFNPVLLSYAIVPADKDDSILLFADKRSVDKEAEERLKELSVVICDYGNIYEYIENMGSGIKVMLDMSKTNSMILKKIPEGVKVENVISPVMQMKAAKNKKEMENERIAHIKDGAAVTKLIYWLKHNVGKVGITEFDVVKKMEEIRRGVDNYLEPSFATISAYSANGAIVHYEPQAGGSSEIEAEGFLLLDTGGHYMEGTTDITRTISLGDLTDTQKKHYTAVLIGNLRLADTKFLYGCRGSNLDCIAREPLWKMGLDYKHGTGHGVGYLLNVHESPNSFRWRVNPSQAESQDTVLEEGMITSDEPGVYIEGEYGIRLENLIMCRKAEENGYGQFMEFEVLTMAPFDRDAIDINMLNDNDRLVLNSYHKSVCHNISPYLNEEERKWLENETKSI